MSTFLFWLGVLLAAGGTAGVFIHLDEDEAYGFARKQCRNCFVICLVGWLILVMSNKCAV